MNTTNTETARSFSDDPRGAMCAFIGGYPWSRIDAMPALDVSIEDIEKSGIFTGLESREAYLRWVADYKALVNQAADHIRRQKALRRAEDDNTRYCASSEADYIGRCVTAAIHMRRLGKRWSAARSEALRAEQAA